ncbi:MAG: hypothetical protein BGO23_09680 [Solirubrobacterales bacterium 67-14]|nr:MAG: hypothetical protein BGO23_09680 [Solirubrobacterales bacterium 67-14]
MQRDVAETPSGLRGARVIFEATVLPNYLANSYFPAELFRAADLVPVGTRGAVAEYKTKSRPSEPRPTKTYLLAGDERSLTKVSELLHEAGPARGMSATARDALRQFDVVRMPPVDDVLRSEPDAPAGALVTWEAVLHPAIAAGGEPSETERRSVLEKWEAWISQLGGEVAVDYERPVKGLTFIPVRLPADAGEIAARFNPLRALRPMPQVRPVPVGPLRIATTDTQLPTPPAGQRPQSDVRIAAFDGGLDDTVAHVGPFATNIDVTPELPDSQAVAHGTMVTSALLYGAFEPDQQLRTPDVGVDHFRVLPVPASDQWDVDLYWILDRIVELVRQRDYPIVNLSLGPNLCLDDDDEPHAWTARLDELTEQHGTLFVCAVGNNGENDGDAGLNRIQVPGDMVNGIGVGACDREAPHSSWKRAAYSAIGPGRPGARIQPIGVAFGGSNHAPYRGIAPGGTIGEAQGTSFAAPTVAHGLAALTATIGQDAATPDVLRAFAIHFAEPGTDNTLIDQVGFGRLAERYDPHWDLPPQDVTILYRDEIERGQTIALPFPLPADVVSGRTLNLRWTLAFVAPTDPTDPVDYTQSGLEVAFRPHARRYTFRKTGTNKSVQLDVQRDREKVLKRLRDGWVPAPLPTTRASERRRNEILQREEGKWETALHYTERMRSSSLFDPQLTVSYLAREGGTLVAAPPLAFAMLLTIQAPTGVELYDAVRSRFNVLTPLTAQIPLRLRAQS